MGREVGLGCELGARAKGPAWACPMRPLSCRIQRRLRILNSNLLFQGPPFVFPLRDLEMLVGSLEEEALEWPLGTRAELSNIG